MTDQHHVITAINAITAELAKEGIAKGRTNQQQGFKFRGIEDVYAALANKLADHQLAILPRVLERVTEVRTAKSGGALYSVALHVNYQFVSALGGATYEASMWGEAMDNGDKATSKAASMAYKYMAFQVFCIPVEGQDDADHTTPEPTQPEPLQSAQKPASATKTRTLLAEEALVEIASCESLAALQALVPVLRASKFTGPDDENVKQAYAAAKKELTPEEG